MSLAQAEASGGSRLIGLSSDYDEIPFVGWLVRLVARQQHDDQRPRLRAEVRRRVEHSATTKMDHEMHRRLAGVEQRVNQRILDPLNRLRLNPKAVEMRTTSQRVILRGRLSSPMQLAAHTPRPQALRDSLLSVQIHESAANNLIQQLDLDGRRMSLEELVTMLSSKLGLDELKLNEDVRDGVTIQFAKYEPVRFQFDADRVLLTIHVAELNNGRRVWRDFSVRGYYRADVSQLEVELERDGAIQLISQQLGLRDQLALRGIFTKVLTRSHRFRILEQAIAQQPRLKNLVLTQCAVRDGWIGLCLGDQPRQRPPRVAAR